MAGNVRTFLLMAVLTALFVWIGGELGGRQGAVLSFVVAAAMNLGAYWFSDKLVLKRYNAREVSEGHRLYDLVAQLAGQADLPMPKVYLIPQPTPNAFATGRNPNHAAVAATEGTLRLLSDDELAGVMAHELAHVRHRDILTGTIAATFAGAITMLAQFARFGSSGNRGRPQGLADALRKISATARRVPLQHGNPAHSHLFIVNPFLGGGLQRLFSSHPPVEERIRRLESLSLR